MYIVISSIRKEYTFKSSVLFKRQAYMVLPNGLGRRAGFFFVMRTLGGKTGSALGRQTSQVNTIMSRMSIWSSDLGLKFHWELMTVYVVFRLTVVVANDQPPPLSCMLTDSRLNDGE